MFAIFREFEINDYRQYFQRNKWPFSRSHSSCDFPIVLYRILQRNCIVVQGARVAIIESRSGD